MAAIQDMSTGFKLALQGLGRARQSGAMRKDYRKITIGIGLIALVMQAAGIWGIWTWTGAEDVVAAVDPGWWDQFVSGLWWLIRVVFRVVGILLVLIMAPVASLQLVTTLVPALAERLFFHGVSLSDEATAELLRQAPSTSLIASTSRSVVRIVLWLMATIVLALFGMIPAVGALAGILGWMFTAMILGHELLDPWLDRVSSPAVRKQYARQSRWLRVGFGLPYAGLLAVPLVGPFLYGLVQTGAGAVAVDASMLLPPVQGSQPEPPR